MDDVSNLVARQYRAYAYLEPFADIQEKINQGYLQYGDPSRFSALLWPEGRPSQTLRILCAGCGTVQAAFYAYTNTDCLVTGVDLSEASLAHERYLQDRHGLTNLRLWQGDLREVGQIGDEFDLIVSTGVLHHMANPDEGLRALASVLAPKGAMFLMVYGATRRIGVYLLQDAFRRMGLQQDAASVSLIREVIELLPPHHYVHCYRALAHDLAHDSGIVDTFLHPQDRAYTVPEVLAFVRQNGLAFQGWLDNSYYYPESIPRASPHRSHIERLPIEEQWAVMENLALAIGCHYFVACHPERLEATRLNFSGSEWLRYKPVRHPAFRTLEPASVDSDRAGRFKRENAELTLPPAQALLLDEAGERTIEQILEHPVFAPHSTDVRHAIARQLY
jgi:SAM-dependent methyltransferase